MGSVRKANEGRVNGRFREGLRGVDCLFEREREECVLSGSFRLVVVVVVVVIVVAVVVVS